MTTSGHRGAALAALLLLGGIVAACGQTPTATPTQVAVATQAPVETDPPFVPPTPEGTPPWEPCARNDGDECIQVAGDYRSTAFEGGVSYSLTTIFWLNYDNAPDLVTLYGADESFDGEMWLEIIGGPVAEGLETPPYTTVEDLMAGLDALAGLGVTSVAGRDLGAYAAEVFDVVHTGSDVVSLFTYHETEGNYFLAPMTTVRFAWLEIDGRPVLVTVEAPTSRFPAFMDAIGTLFLDSIAFGD